MGSQRPKPSWDEVPKASEVPSGEGEEFTTQFLDRSDLEGVLGLGPPQRIRKKLSSWDRMKLCTMLVKEEDLALARLRRYGKKAERQKVGEIDTWDHVTLWRYWCLLHDVCWEDRSPSKIRNTKDNPARIRCQMQMKSLLKGMSPREAKRWIDNAVANWGAIKQKYRLGADRPHLGLLLKMRDTLAKEVSRGGTWTSTFRRSALADGSGFDELLGTEMPK